MNINSWLAKHAAGDFDEGFCKLLDGRTDTTAAKNIWMEIASGEASVEETLAWAQYVACKIKRDLLESKSETSSVRERVALRAIGFFGVVDTYREAKRLMDIIADFSPLDKNGKSLPNRLTAEQWLQYLKSHGLMTEVNHKTALNLINTWRKELKIE